MKCLKIKQPPEIKGNTANLAETCIKILTLLLHYPKGSLKLFYFLIIIVCIGWGLVDYGFIGFIIYYINNNPFSYYEISDAVAGMLSSFGLHIYQLSWLYTRSSIDIILKNLGDFTKYEKPRGIDILVTLASKLLMNCPVEDGKCGFLLPAYMYGFNVWGYPRRQFYSIFQMTMAFIFGSTAVYGFILLLCCYEFLNNRLDQLKHMLLMIPSINVVDRKNHIKKCVLYHYNIIDLHEQLTNSSSIQFLWHVPQSTVMITVIAYQLILKYDFTNMVHLFLWTLIIFAVCLAGERLITTSLHVSDVAFESVPWDGDIATQKSLLLIMIRAQKPLTIPAGLFGIFQQVLFISIVKTAYSIITLLLESE